MQFREEALKTGGYLLKGINAALIQIIVRREGQEGRDPYHGEKSSGLSAISGPDDCLRN